MFHVEQNKQKSMPNRYSGRCGCGKMVLPGDGVVEMVGRKWKVWCADCFNKSDNSGPEDRCCGNRAYEDACARVCGGDNYDAFNGF